MRSPATSLRSPRSKSRCWRSHGRPAPALHAAAAVRRPAAAARRRRGERGRGDRAARRAVARAPRPAVRARAGAAPPHQRLRRSRARRAGDAARAWLAGRRDRRDQRRLHAARRIGAGSSVASSTATAGVRARRLRAGSRPEPSGPAPPFRPSLTTVAEPPCDSAIAARSRGRGPRRRHRASASIAAVEALERVPELLVGEAGPGVGDLEHGACRRRSSTRTGRAGPCRRVRAHVREQVVEDLTQPLAVAFHLDRAGRVELDLAARIERSRRLDGVAGDVRRARRACARAAGPGRGGRAAGGRRRAAPSAATRAGCRSSPARGRRAARGRRGRRARRRRAPRRAACAARARRRRRSGAAAARTRCARRTRPRSGRASCSALRRAGRPRCAGRRSRRAARGRRPRSRRPSARSGRADAGRRARARGRASRIAASTESGDDDLDDEQLVQRVVDLVERRCDDEQLARAPSGSNWTRKRVPPLTAATVKGRRSAAARVARSPADRLRQRRLAGPRPDRGPADGPARCDEPT